MQSLEVHPKKTHRYAECHLEQPTAQSPRTRELTGICAPDQEQVAMMCAGLLNHASGAVRPSSQHAYGSAATTLAVT